MASITFQTETAARAYADMADGMTEATLDDCLASEYFSLSTMARECADSATFPASAEFAPYLTGSAETVLGNCLDESFYAPEGADKSVFVWPGEVTVSCPPPPPRVKRDVGQLTVRQALAVAMVALDYNRPLATLGADLRPIPTLDPDMADAAVVTLTALMAQRGVAVFGEPTDSLCEFADIVIFG